MTDILEIEGQIVRHIRREVVAETSLAQMAPHIERRAPSIYPILPNNTILAAFDPDAQRGGILVERAPERVNMNVHFDAGLTGNTPAADFNRGGARTTRARFNIQLPYLYFAYGFKLNARPVGDHVGLAGFTLDRSLLYWRPDPLRKMDDRLWQAQLPNLNRAVICWGYPTWDNQDTLAMRINQMVNEFPITTFTNHYGMPRPPEYDSYVAWEAASADNPLLFRDWAQFKDNAHSVEAGAYILKLMSGDHGPDYGDIPRPEDMIDILIPEPPRQFTIGRLRDWIAEIPEPMRRRFLAEAARVGDGDTLEAATDG